MLDFRTVLLSYVVSNAICMLVVAMLWRQNRNRFAGLHLWFVDFAMQFVAIALVALRGVVPDFISMVVSNGLVIGGTMLLNIGLERFVGRRGPQWHNLVILPAFLCVQWYFAFVTPSLAMRNINVSVALFVVCLQGAWIMLRKVDDYVRPAARLTAFILFGIVVISAVRVGFDWVAPPQEDIFKSHLHDTLTVMAYQMLQVALTFSLYLVANRRLVGELELDLAERTRLAAANRQFEAIVQSSDDAIISKTLDGIVTSWNPGAEAMFGYTSAEMIGTPMLALYPVDRQDEERAILDRIRTGERVEHFETQRLHRNGTVIDVSVTISPIRDEKGRVVGASKIARNIVERKRTERELSRLATTDTLTGLANRAQFMSRAAQELARTARYGGPLSVLMLDIDHFKAVNDTHGHQTGDHVLESLGRLLREALRDIDLAGRVGGEEFAVLLPQTALVHAVEAAERLRAKVAAMEVPLERGVPLRITISIGVASHTGEGINLDTLLSQADTALYDAKHAGRNRVCTYRGASAA